MIMDYIPGQIHQKLQKEHFFLVNYDFVWSNCGPKRFNEMSDSKDWDETESINLSKGDTIVVRFFKGKPTSSTYSYLERVIYRSGDSVQYKKESIISLDFILKNTGYLFTDVTKSFERDKLIEMLLV